MPRTPAPSTDNEDEGSEHSEHTIESGAPDNTTEEEILADLAESIHINPPAMATMTKTGELEEINYLRRERTEDVNPQMGHPIRRIVNVVDNEAAL